MFSSFIRDSFCGRIIYHLSKHTLLNYEEEKPEYVAPETYHVSEKGAKEVSFQLKDEKKNNPLQTTQIMILKSTNAIRLGTAL